MLVRIKYTDLNTTLPNKKEKKQKRNSTRINNIQRSPTNQIVREIKTNKDGYPKINANKFILDKKIF